MEVAFFLTFACGEIEGDMYQIAVRWTEYAPRVVEIHPELFAEMKGLIYSTLQLKLPFTLIKSLTVSWTKNGYVECTRLGFLAGY